MIHAGTFPRPVNGRGKKLLWSQSSIESWMRQQSEPVNVPIVTAPTKCQAEKSRQSRLEAAHATLERHRGKVKWRNGGKR
jgi:hypothetical protein